MELNLLIENEGKSLANASLYSIGKSVMGKELFLIRSGNGEKKLFLSGGHHGNEWITALVLLRFAKELSENKSLRESVSFYILPLGNPDGAALCRGELNSGGFYENAKRISLKFPEIPFPEGWKANISGFDLNLSYPAGFNKAKEIKKSKGFDLPAPRDYPGEVPLSQPESKAIYELVLKENFDMLLTFHTQGEVIYYKYGDFNPEKSEEIAYEMGKRSGYFPEIAPEESGNAGLKDWFIKEFNRPGFTIEAGQGISPLPLECFDKIYKECSEIIKTAVYFLLLK